MDFRSFESGAGPYEPQWNLDPESYQLQFEHPAAALVDVPYPIAEISVISLTTSYTTSEVPDDERLLASLEDGLSNFHVAEMDPTEVDEAFLRSLTQRDVAAVYEPFAALLDGHGATETRREWLTIRQAETIARATMQDAAVITYVCNHAEYQPRIRMLTGQRS